MSTPPEDYAAFNPPPDEEDYAEFVGPTSPDPPDPPPADNPGRIVFRRRRGGGM